MASSTEELRARVQEGERILLHHDSKTLIDNNGSMQAPLPAWMLWQMNMKDNGRDEISVGYTPSGIPAVVEGEAIVITPADSQSHE